MSGIIPIKLIHILTLKMHPPLPNYILLHLSYLMTVKEYYSNCPKHWFAMALLFRSMHLQKHIGWTHMVGRDIFVNFMVFNSHLPMVIIEGKHWVEHKKRDEEPHSCTSYGSIYYRPSFQFPTTEFTNLVSPSRFHLQIVCYILI